MGQGSSRQTKDLVPSSRKTKELGRPEADSFSVSCQTKAKSKTSRIPAPISIVTNSRGPTRHFPKIYFYRVMRYLGGICGWIGLDKNLQSEDRSLRVLPDTREDGQAAHQRIDA